MNSLQPPQIIKTTFGNLIVASLDEALAFVSAYDFVVAKSGLFKVWKIGQSEDDAYYGDLSEQDCPCGDHHFRGRICKHLRALNRLLVEDLLDFSDPRAASLCEINE